MLRIPIALALLLAGLPGCVDLGGDYVEQRFYDLEARRSDPARTPAPGTVLRVRRFRASERADSVEILTRTAGGAWQPAFYDRFLVSPSEMLMGETTKWLTEAGLFGNVTPSPLYVEPTHYLEGNLVAIHRDETDPANQKAVLEVQFFLIDDVEDPARILFQLNLRKEVPVTADTAQALVAALNEALTQALRELEEKIAGIDLRSRP